MDMILIILKKKWSQGFICSFTWAIFHISQTQQISGDRLTGPLVLWYYQTIFHVFGRMIAKCDGVV